MCISPTSSTSILLALEKATAGSLFYAENGEANFKSVAQSIGRMLGLGDETKDWPIGEAVEGLGPGRLFELRLEQPRAREAVARAWLGAEGARAVRRDREGVYAEVYGKK